MKKEDKRDVLNYCLIFGGIVLLVPTIIGLILYLVWHSPYYFEATFCAMGCLGLIFVLGRSRRRDTKNYKANRTVVEGDSEEEKEAYKVYKYSQLICTLISILDFVIAGVLFLILRYGLNLKF